MTLKVSAPIAQPKSLNYSIECRNALLPGVEQVFQAAVKAGWNPKTVGYEIMFLGSSMAKEPPEIDAAGT
jgi:hypothetical protein